ncbi:ExbD/TolR family protein [Albibacterium bauzanense]|uniref:Outer membrane transport energization protein ExbD n=1 Tax=Albibacterium bauzanense TaxID=653929 RepID=A0A4R1LUT9_9SPHI|nr:biopolymer transporter ExbD [Albibacterium bauzanense]TCK82845.1 outer membrane transport energization protein ExbD [Albibacterium bauzanense]
MGKIKIKRANTTIDMTAMCDVSFLLLTFFILTATARQPEPLPVDMPASTVQIKVPDTNLGTLTVGDGGKVFFGVTGPNVRINMLNRISEKYGITFTDDEKQRFSLIDAFGVPISRLKDLIAMDNTQRIAKGVQPGIPADSTDNQLREWVLAARLATAEVNDQQMRVAIKGDAEEDYPAIKKVIDVLQEQSLNKFSLITNLRVAD